MSIAKGMAKYKTIIGKVTAEYKEKGSSFLAYVYGISTKDEIDDILINLKKEHPQARHFCYAYRLGVKGEDYRINDDGEPKNSAGMPIYNQLKSFEVTNILAIVVRYFGGTKLGVSGLVSAYKTATQSALSTAEIIEKEETEIIEIICDYSIIDRVKYHIQQTESCQILQENYTDKIHLKIEISKEQLTDFKQKIEELGGELVEKD
jgi:uncharacterized YigZ family protein